MKYDVFAAERKRGMERGWKSEPHLWRRNTARLTNFDSRLARTEAFHVLHYDAKRLSPSSLQNERGSERKRRESVRKTMRHLAPGRIFSASCWGWDATEGNHVWRCVFPRREQFPPPMEAEREPTVFKSSEKIRVITDSRAEEDARKSLQGRAVSWIRNKQETGGKVVQRRFENQFLQQFHKFY